MLIYYILDIISASIETFGLYYVTGYLCKKNRFNIYCSRIILPVSYFVFVWLLTWFTDLGACKIFFISVFIIVSVEILFKEPFYYGVLIMELYYTILLIFPEALGETLMYWLYDGVTTAEVDGVFILKWQVQICIIIIRLLMIGIVYKLLKNCYYKIQLKDFFILTMDFLLLFSFSFVSIYDYLNLQKKGSALLNVIVSFLSVIFAIQFLYSRNVSYLRKKEEQSQIQLAMLKQQYAFYQVKLESEERVRGIYHDLKNHLLIMEGQKEIPKTNQIAKDLLSQIEDYEDYVHTGNEFLDIIIKDKAEKAREKSIDFSVVVDFKCIDFIDTLDISTIFGNAIDNAIEASERLPKEQRLITVKADNIRDMLVISVENNMLSGASFTKETTKKDSFAHGFGIPNIENAAEKYGGQCSIKAERGTFLLRILIPIP